MSLVGGQYGLCHCDTVNVIQWLFCANAILLFVLLQFDLDVPYGRYRDSKWTRSCAWIWEGTINANVSWFLQELPSFVVPVLLAVWYNSQRASIANAILLSMFCVHYFHRAFIFPLLIRGNTRTPFILFVIAFVFCSLNGYVQGCSLVSCNNYPSDWTSQPNFYLGVILFFVGMAINIHSDHILRNLRKPGETGHKIPTGGMFNYVSGANYFGEIVEWCGFALACWSMPATSFAIFTVANIGPRALAHHRWYKLKFAEDYPKNRCGLIPFLL